MGKDLNLIWDEKFHKVWFVLNNDSFFQHKLNVNQKNPWNFCLQCVKALVEYLIRIVIRLLLYLSTASAELLGERNVVLLIKRNQNNLDEWES